MSDEIKTLKDEIVYMSEIRKKLTSTGQVILSAHDSETIHRIMQSLNCFRMYLSAFDKVTADKQN